MHVYFIKGHLKYRCNVPILGSLRFGAVEAIFHDCNRFHYHSPGISEVVAKYSMTIPAQWLESSTYYGFVQACRLTNLLGTSCRMRRASECFLHHCRKGIATSISVHNGRSTEVRPMQIESLLARESSLKITSAVRDERLYIYMHYVNLSCDLISGIKRTTSNLNNSSRIMRASWSLLGTSMPDVVGGGYLPSSRRQLYLHQIVSCPAGTGIGRGRERGRCIGRGREREMYTFRKDVVQCSSVQTSLMSLLLSTEVISAAEN